MLSDLNTTKGIGLDHLPARFLRDTAEVNTLAVAHIINLFIKPERVPGGLKKARIISLD